MGEDIKDRKIGIRRRKERLWDGLLIELKKRCAGGEEW
jgi:hypothetical protein